MGCKPILERHCRLVAALTLTLGVNGPLSVNAAANDRCEHILTKYQQNATHNSPPDIL